MVPVAITGNIFDEATTSFGDIICEATRGRGMTVREIRGYLLEMYGADVMTQ